MISFYDKLEENLGNTEEITNLLISLDYMLERLHNYGFYVYDFNMKKMIMYDDKLTPSSFNGLLNDIGNDKNASVVNILQLCKVGINAYNNILDDGRMNQDHLDTICNNFKVYNLNGNIPEEIYEYYGEIFERFNIGYLNNYLIKKQQENLGNQNSNVLRKTKATPIGIAYAKADEENAFVNILFIPTIMAFLYLIGLIIYVFVIK